MKPLSTRERIAVAIGAAALLLALLLAGVVAPYRAALQRLDARIASRQQQLTTMQGLRQDYQRLTWTAGATERRLQKSNGFALVPYLENLVGGSTGREKLVHLRPQTVAAPPGYRAETVELTLEKVRLDQLVRLLHGIDSADACLVTRAVKAKPRFDDRSLLDVVLAVSVYSVQP